MTFFFRQIGGGEIDGDAAGRKRKAGSNERRTHVLLGLRHSFVRQPDDGPPMLLMTILRGGGCGKFAYRTRGRRDTE
jgi:hypothetical protein